MQSSRNPYKRGSGRPADESCRWRHGFVAMNKSDSDPGPSPGPGSRLSGVTPFPDEPHELALVLYESCNMRELISQLETDVDESILKEWNLTLEQYREELLFAKLLLEND